jgi:osmotically-inducible protein OsmY
MKLSRFSKTLLSQTLIIAGLSTGIGLNIANAAESSAPAVESTHRADIHHDHDVSRRVSTRLSHQPSLNTSDIRVKTKDGRVTLYGTVHSQHAKYVAVSTAKATIGVRAVISKLTVRSVHHAMRSGH